MGRAGSPEIPHNCVICDKPLTREKGRERIVTFNKRKTCSAECRYKLHSRWQLENFEQLSKQCQRCGKTFYKRRGQNMSENISRWNSRKFCSHKCGTESLRDRAQKKSPKLKCGWCRKVKERPRGTSIAKWAERRFCKPECARAAEQFFAKNGRRKCQQCDGYIYPKTKSWREPEKWKTLKYCSRTCKATYRQEHLVERPKEKYDKSRPWRGSNDSLKKLAEAYRRKHNGRLPDVDYDPTVCKEPTPPVHEWIQHESEGR